MLPQRAHTRNPSRNARLRGIGAALIVAAMAGAPAGADAATGRATVQTERTSARLVLEWPRPVDYTVSQSGSYVLIRFSRPFTGSLEKARGPLARYASELRLAGDGRVLVLRHSGKPYFAHLRRGNSVVLTWIGASSPERARPPERTTTPERAKPPERGAPAERASVEKPAKTVARTTPSRRSTAADNPTDSDDPPPGAKPTTPAAPRMAARPEPPKRPVTPPELHADRLSPPKSGAPAPKSPMVKREDRLARPASPSELQAARPPKAKADTSLPKSPVAESEHRPDRPAVAPEMHAARPPQPKSGAPAPKSPTAEREDGPGRPAAPPAARVGPGPSEAPDAAKPGRARPSAPYTDALLPPPRPLAPPPRVNRPAPAPPERAPPSGPALKSPGAAGDALPPRPAPPPAVQAERPAVPQPNVPRPAAPAAPRAEAARLPQSMAKVPEAKAPPAPDIRPAPEARPAPDGPLEPPVMPAISPTLNVTTDGGETRIVLAWPEPVAAAVFCLGDHVWMVFPRREAFDLQKAQKLLGPGVEGLKRIEHAQATLLAARVAAGMRVRVAHERNVWTVALKRENGAPALPDVKLAISRNGIEEAALPLPGAETPIRFVVPDTGSVLYVVPSRATAAAGGERAFVTFRILPAAQGGVIEALADGLTVGAEGGAIKIRRTAGLLLSNGGPPMSLQHGQ